MKKTILTLGIIGTLVGGDVLANPYTETADTFEIDGVKILKSKPEISFGDFVVSYEKVKQVGERKTMSDKIEWKDGKEKVNVYPLSNGDIEMEVILEEKPKDDEFCFVVSEGFTYLKNTGEDFTPEDSIGSYSVYEKGSFGGGKLLHIYRPKVIDGNGVETWAFLDYKNGEMCVTIPEKVFDDLNTNWNGFIIDPTFGKITDGASSTAASSDNKVVSAATPASGGVVSSMTCRMWLSSAGTMNVRGVIYSDVLGALTAASALLAVTDDAAFTNTSEQEVTMTFSGANQITVTSGQQYWIGFHVQDPGTPSWTISRDGTADGRKVNGDDVWSDGSAALWGADITSLAGPIDCYVTYGAATTNIEAGIIFDTF